MRLPDETWMCHTVVYQVDDGKDMGTHLPPEHRNSQLGRTKNSHLSRISLCIAREILTLAWTLQLQPPDVVVESVEMLGNDDAFLI